MAKVPEELYRFNPSEIARVCRVDLATARRWKRGATCPPETALMMLRGDLGCFNAAWKGWTISQRGELCSPENWIATTGDVLSIQLTQAQLSAYRTENRALKIALEAKEAGYYEEQPLPSEWEIASA